MARSFMLQRIFPINVAPTWMNKNTVFFTNIACELVFLYLCYALYVVPNIKLFYAIPALLVLRWLVNWMAKMRAVGVYIFHLKDQIQNETDESELYFYNQLLDKVSNNKTEFWNECKKNQFWKTRD